MNFKSFCDQIVSVVSELYPECKVKLCDVNKNNGVTYNCLDVARPRDKISEVIYLEPLYEAFLDGTSFMEIIEKIKKARLESRNVFFDLDYFMDYDKVREKIMYKLINYEKNKKLLSEVPHRKFKDLAIVYYCLVASKASEGVVLIKNVHTAAWNITEEDLYDAACANAIIKNDHDLFPLMDVINDRLGLRKEKNLSGGEMSEDDPLSCLKILTNKDKTYGAAVMLNPGLLCALSRKYNKNFYIIPSSVHEVILVLDDGSFDQIKADRLYEMVSFVNMTEVETEDVLSDNIYYYDRAEDELSDYNEIASKTGLSQKNMDIKGVI